MAGPCAGTSPGTSSKVEVEQLRASIQLETFQLQADLARLWEERETAGAALQRAIGDGRGFPCLEPKETFASFSLFPLHIGDSLGTHPVQGIAEEAPVSHELLHLMHTQLQAVARERDEAWARAEAMERSLERERIAAQTVAAHAVEAQEASRAELEAIRRCDHSEAHSADLNAELEAAGRVARKGLQGDLLREVQEQLAKAIGQGEELQKKLVDPGGGHCSRCDGSKGPDQLDASAAATLQQATLIAQQRVEIQAMQGVAEGHQATIAGYKEQVLAAERALAESQAESRVHLAEAAARERAAEQAHEEQAAVLRVMRNEVEEQTIVQAERDEELAASQAARVELQESLDSREVLVDTVEEQRSQLQAIRKAAEDRALAVQREMQNSEAKLAAAEAQHAALTRGFEQADKLCSEALQQKLVDAQVELAAADAKAAALNLSLQTAERQGTAACRRELAEIQSQLWDSEARAQGLEEVERQQAESIRCLNFELHELRSRAAQHWTRHGADSLGEVKSNTCKDDAHVLAGESEEARRNLAVSEARQLTHENNFEDRAHALEQQLVEAHAQLAASEARCKVLEAEPNACAETTRWEQGQLRSEIDAAVQEAQCRRESPESLCTRHAGEFAQKTAALRLERHELVVSENVSFEALSLERDELAARVEANSEAATQKIEELKDRYAAAKVARDAVVRLLESEQETSKQKQEQLDAVKRERDRAMALAEAASLALAGAGRRSSPHQQQAKVQEEQVQAPGARLRDALRDSSHGTNAHPEATPQQDAGSEASSRRSSIALVPKPLPPRPLTPPPQHPEEPDDAATDTCSSCGNIYAQDAQFCRECGAKRQEGTEENDAANDTCPRCGNIYAADALFCRKCGTERTQAAEELHEQPDSESVATQHYFGEDSAMLDDTSARWGPLFTDDTMGSEPLCSDGTFGDDICSAVLLPSTCALGESLNEETAFAMASGHSGLSNRDHSPGSASNIYGASCVLAMRQTSKGRHQQQEQHQQQQQQQQRQPIQPQPMQPQRLHSGQNQRMEDLQNQISSSCTTPTTTIAPVEDQWGVGRMYLDASILTTNDDALAASSGRQEGQFRERSDTAETTVPPPRRLCGGSSAQITPRRMSAELVHVASQPQVHVSMHSQHHVAAQPQAHFGSHLQGHVTTQPLNLAVTSHAPNSMQHLTPSYASLPAPSTTPRSSVAQPAAMPVTPRRSAPESWPGSRVQVLQPGARVPPVQVDTQRLPMATMAFGSWQPPTRPLHVT